MNVTGGIGLNLKNWAKKLDASGQSILDENGDPILEEKYPMRSGSTFRIDTKRKKLFNGDEAVVDIADALTPQKLESIRAGGSYAVIFGKKLQNFAAQTIGKKVKSAFAASKEITDDTVGLTAVEKIFNRNAINSGEKKILHAGSDIRVKVNICGIPRHNRSNDFARTRVHGRHNYRSIPRWSLSIGCHTASVWDKKARANIPKLMSFMSQFGLAITARDPEDKYKPMTDVIHKVLNDMTVDDWAIIIGGDSHTRMSRESPSAQTRDRSPSF